MRNRSAATVNRHSVPSCLWHGHSTAALEDARALAAFLKEAVEGMMNSDTDSSQDAAIGAHLCFSLLQDKLSIAAGELAFPQVSAFSETEAVLWRDPEDQGGAA